MKEHASTTVCILQPRVYDYRRRFFEVLGEVLGREDIQLVVTGGVVPSEQAQGDVLDALPFGRRCRNRTVLGKLYWQEGALENAREADMVIFEHSASALHTYPLLFSKVFGLERKRKIAYWGHGPSLAVYRRAPFRRAWKRWLTRQVDWWFAYTEEVARSVVAAGVPESEVTVCLNSIDTASLQAARQALTEPAVSQAREALFGPGDGARRIGIFCGRFLPEKKMSLLLAAAAQIHDEQSAFRFLIVGDGPDKPIVDAFCSENTWARSVGACFGVERMKYLAAADIFLNPGRVGLNILDAYAAGIPFATTESELHSPEIAYLVPEETGLITERDAGLFAGKVVALLSDPERLSKMKKCIGEEIKKYSAEKMAYGFAKGILACLGRPGDSLSRMFADEGVTHGE